MVQVPYGAEVVATAGARASEEADGRAARSARTRDTIVDAYLELDATTAYDAAWYRKYVIVVPQGSLPPPPVPPVVAPPTPLPFGEVVAIR